MQTKYKIFLSLALIVFVILGRILPHSWNFTPLVAVGLFAGAYLGIRYSIGISLVSMFVSDILIGFYNPFIMASVYGSIMIFALFGLFLQKKISATKIITLSFVSSTLFFLITNTAVWAFGTMYLHSFSGLLQSLFAGIPFYRNMVIGDVYFSAMLFGSYQLISLIVKLKKSEKVLSSI